MAKSSKLNAIRIVVPTEFYSVLWGKRFDNKNSQSIFVYKNESFGIWASYTFYKDETEYYKGLEYTDGVRTFYVFPTLDPAPEDFFKA